MRVGPHLKQVEPANEVRLLCLTAPIGRAQVQHSRMHVVARSIVKPHARKICDIEGE